MPIRAVGPDARKFYNVSAVAPSWVGMPATLSTESRPLARAVSELLKKAGFKGVRLVEFREEKRLAWKDLKVK